MAASDSDAPGAVPRAIAEREQKVARLEGQLAALRAVPGAIDFEARRMEREARRRLDELAALLGRNVEQGRRAMEALLDGPLKFTPTVTDKGRSYLIEGRLATGAFFRIDSDPNGI